MAFLLLNANLIFCPLFLISKICLFIVVVINTPVINHIILFANFFYSMLLSLMFQLYEVQFTCCAKPLYKYFMKIVQ